MKSYKNTIIVIAVIIIVILGVYVLLTRPASHDYDLNNQSTTTIATTSLSTTPATTSNNNQATYSNKDNWQNDMQIVTGQGLNETVHVKKNERFIIQLGSGLNWNLVFDTEAIDKEAIITRVPNSTT